MEIAEAVKLDAQDGNPSKSLQPMASEPSAIGNHHVSEFLRVNALKK